MSMFFTVVLTIILWNIFTHGVLSLSYIPNRSKSHVARIFLEYAKHCSDISNALKSISKDIKDMGTTTRNNELKDIGYVIDTHAERLFSKQDKKDLQQIIEEYADDPK